MPDETKILLREARKAARMASGTYSIIAVLEHIDERLCKLEQQTTQAPPIEPGGYILPKEAAELRETAYEVIAEPRCPHGVPVRFKCLTCAHRNEMS